MVALILFWVQQESEIYQGCQKFGYRFSSGRLLTEVRDTKTDFREMQTLMENLIVSENINTHSTRSRWPLYPSCLPAFSSPAASMSSV